MAPGTASARPSPVVIGGLGGSGTRAVMRIVEAGGRFMGANLNESGDALDFYGFGDRWLGAYHEARVEGREVAQREELLDDLRGCVWRHRLDLGGRVPWGWKQPRSIHFLPLLNEAFPDLRFIHVIRDGRDIAFGPQAAGVLERAEAILPTPPGDPAPLRVIELWSRANTLAADYGESRMGAAYLRLRLEDLCASPGPLIERLCEFEGSGEVGARGIRELSKEIHRPDSLGRWRTGDDEMVERASAIGGQALERFGYGLRNSS
jgi:hypothetical protein